MAHARRFTGLWLVTVLVAGMSASDGRAQDGFAMYGEPKYPATFAHFDYVEPTAPKGGEMQLGFKADFDTLNPFSLKGLPPTTLETLVFQSLGDSSLDEAATVYPALARSFVVRLEERKIDVELRADARFSDGRPVTAKDVAFSVELFHSDQVSPRFQSSFRDVKRAVVHSPRRLTIELASSNPALAIAALKVPILPEHVYGRGDFGRDYSDVAVGSGPYRVKSYQRGIFVELERDPNFWGARLPLYAGRANLDTIRLKFYRDETVLLEDFKKGAIDYYWSTSSKIWARGLTGKKFDELGWIRKELFPHESNMGTQAYYMNLRRPLFSDRRVRMAIALAFDFDWSNRVLFFNQYEPNTSFFENSPLKATGLPTPDELAVLRPLAADLPEDVFTEPVGGLGAGLSRRERLVKAQSLLTEAGYRVDPSDGIAKGPKGPLVFHLMIDNAKSHRYVEPYVRDLARLGIKVTVDLREPAVYVQQMNQRDFDMLGVTFVQPQAPGLEQRDFWTSAAAKTPYSRNAAGVSNHAVDELVERISSARDDAELTLYVRCLDRVLYHLHFAVHQWHSAHHRVAYWAKFSRPATFPRFYDPWQYIQLVWSEPSKERRLKDLVAGGAPLVAH